MVVLTAAQSAEGLECCGSCSKARIPPKEALQKVISLDCDIMRSGMGWRAWIGDLPLMDPIEPTTHAIDGQKLEAQRNIELMWLTGRLAPDFKTIADFRKDNGAAIRAVCS